MTRRDLTGYRPSTRPGAIIGYRKNGTPIRLIGGGDGTGDPAPPAAPAPAPPAGGLTQEQVNRIAAQEKAEGRNAALREVADTLGMTVDEAKAFIEDKRKADEAAKTEEQRRLEALTAREKAAEERERTAAATLRAANIRTALAATGSLGDDQADATILLERSIAADADQAAIDKAVEELKARRPELFRGTATPKPAAPNSDPGSGPKGNQDVKPGEFGSKGAEEAARRWGTKSA